MDFNKDLATALVVFSFTIFLQCSTTVGSPLHRRSIHLNTNQGLTVSDGFVRDIMIITSDLDRDNLMSSAEIAYFYNQVAGYNEYASQLLGDSFIEHGDLDGDHLLDEHELLVWLQTIGTRWTRRR
ncbi:hypothetical protein ACF0H5_012561 [Mactra antiquata]